MNKKRFAEQEERANSLQRELDFLHFENESVLKQKDDLNSSVVKLRDELEVRSNRLKL